MSQSACINSFHFQEQSLLHSTPGQMLEECNDQGHAVTYRIILDSPLLLWHLRIFMVVPR